MVAITRKGLCEGNYTSWTMKWIAEPTDHFSGPPSIDALIDEKNSVISVSYRDRVSHWQFGVYNLEDFSVIFESTAGVDYTYKPATIEYKRGLCRNMAYFDYGGISHSLQTYLLLMRLDRQTIEVWRGGSTALWTRTLATDFGRGVWLKAGSISLTGKYLLIPVQDKTSPYFMYLILYEGT